MHTQQELRPDSHGGYVAHANWLVNRGRADLVDLVADEFERRDQSANPSRTRTGR